MEVYIANLPRGFTEAEFAELLQSTSTQSPSFRFAQLLDGQSCGFALYPTAHDATTAVTTLKYVAGIKATFRREWLAFYCFVIGEDQGATGKQEPVSPPAPLSYQNGHWGTLQDVKHTRDETASPIPTTSRTPSLSKRTPSPSKHTPSPSPTEACEESKDQLPPWFLPAGEHADASAPAKLEMEPSPCPSSCPSSCPSPIPSDGEEIKIGYEKPIRVYFSNLPSTVDSIDGLIALICRECGPIAMSDHLVNVDHRNTWACVTFRSIKDALRVIGCLHGKVYEGKPLLARTTPSMRIPLRPIENHNDNSKDDQKGNWQTEKQDSKGKGKDAQAGQENMENVDQNGPKDKNSGKDGDEEDVKGEDKAKSKEEHTRREQAKKNAQRIHSAVIAEANVSLSLAIAGLEHAAVEIDDAFLKVVRVARINDSCMRAAMDATNAAMTALKAAMRWLPEER